MEIAASAREHLFETISRQYEPDDAETMKAMLTTASTEHLATKQDIAELKIEFKDALHQETRTHISWMFGLLTVYTAMAGSFIALATIITSR
ncbi:MAG: hypothetical protein QOI95_265 [Acidimicrobiaceae bacterium]